MTQSNVTDSRTDARCLFRHYDNPSLCSPLSPAYIAIHGMDGKGGRLANAGIPEDYRGLLLADSPAREGQAEVYAKLEAYAKSFTRQFPDVMAEVIAEGKTPNEARIKSLYLWSESPGTGKTTTAIALMGEYLLTHFIGSLKRKESPLQRPVYFVDMTDLITDYNAFNRPRVPDDIADIGVRSNVSEALRGDIHSLINHRVTNQKPTIYTSNLPMKQLEDVFGEKRLVDRISDLTLPMHFTGNSKRGVR